MKKKGGGGGGAKPCVHVHKHMYTRGVWGHAPPENFDCFWCILRDFVVNREFLIWKQGGGEI